MTRPRYYIQRDFMHPEQNLWAEIENAMGGYPKLHLYGNYDQKSVKIMTLPAPAADRLASVIYQFHQMVTDVRPDYNPHDNDEGEK